MSADELLDRGLIALDGEPTGIAIVRQLLKDGFADGVSADVGARAQPMRAFGPAR
jgi:hypothetical protein